MSESESPHIPKNEPDENIFGTPIVPSTDPLPDLTPTEAELAQSWQRTTQLHTERTEDRFSTAEVEPGVTTDTERMKAALEEYVDTATPEYLSTLSMEEIPKVITKDNPRRFETYGVDYDSFMGELNYQQSLMINRLSPHFGDLASASEVAFPIAVEHAAQMVKLQTKNKILEMQLNSDVLTNTLNNQYFKETLPNVINESIAENRDLAMLFLDIDGFKAVNDVHGHEEGDNSIVRLAEVVVENVRDIDLVIHRSGDEFVVLLRNVKPEKAVEIGERIREGVSKSKITHQSIGQEVPDITISMGLTTSSTAKTPKEFLDQAEIAMSHSKRDLQGKPQKDRLTSFVEGMVIAPGGEKGRSTDTNTTVQE